MGALAHFPDAAAARLAGKLLRRHSPHQIAEAIEVLIDVLDQLGGDPEAEDNGDLELGGDDMDIAWPEWRGRGEQRPTGTLTGGTFGTPYVPHEDDEDDDPLEADGDELDTGNAEDEVSVGYAWRTPGADGAGCPISDPDHEGLSIPGGGSDDWASR